jgi:hypothetical protein
MRLLLAFFLLTETADRIHAQVPRPVVAAASAAATSAFQDEAKGKEETPFVEAIVRRLRTRCVQRPELRGAFVQSAVAKDGTLKIAGSLDNAEQAGALVAEAKTLLAEVPAWAAQTSNGVDVKDMKVVPIRSKILPRLRHDLAELVLSKDEEKWTESLRRTRLDDVHFDPETGKLAFVGVTLLSADPEVPTIPYGLLAEALQKLLRMDYQLRDLQPGGTQVSVREIRSADEFFPRVQESMSQALSDQFLLKGARYQEDGKLVLAGWFGAGKKAALEQTLKEGLGKLPCWREAEPRWDLSEMREIDWPIDLVRWNRLLAEEAPAFQLDRLYFGLDRSGTAKVRFDGNFVRHAVLNIHTPALPGRLFARLKADWPEAAKHVGAKGISTESLESVRYKDLAGTIQRALKSDLAMKSDLGWSDVLIEDASLSVDHVLSVNVHLTRDEQAAPFRAWLADRFGTPADKKGERYRIVERIQVENMLLPLQTVLAQADEPKGQKIRGQTRLDRIAFGFDANEELVVRVAGLGIHLDHKLNPKDTLGIIKPELKNACAKRWPALKARFPNFEVEFEEFDANVGTTAMGNLAKAIAEIPALDGILLGGEPVYDANGRLIFTGFWQGAAQEPALLQLVDDPDIFGAGKTRLAARGVATDRLLRTPTPAVLKSLREYASRSLNEARLDRLHFDGKGVPTLRGVAPDMMVATDLADRATELLRKSNEGDRILDRGDAKLSVVPQFAELPKKGLIGEFRKRTDDLHDPKWNGLLLRRISYGVDGTMVVEGLLESSEQSAPLEAMLRKMADEPQWRGFMSGPVRLVGFEVVPLAEILQGVRKLKADFETLDEVRLERLRHDLEGRLTVDGFEIEGSHSSTRIVPILRQLVESNPAWRKRLAFGVSDLQLTPVRRNPAVALEGLGRVVSHYQYPFPPEGPLCFGCGTSPTFAKQDPVHDLDELDIVLFHLPKDSLAWYMAGTSWLARGNIDDAKRFYRRMNRLEFDDHELRRGRLIAIEMFQGQFRSQSTQVATQAGMQVIGGH